MLRSKDTFEELSVVISKEKGYIKIETSLPVRPLTFITNANRKLKSVDNPNESVDKNCQMK